ncbi:MAG TPA: hypothetical protein VIX89_15225 [Bryobacteraceae bacterium]
MTKRFGLVVAALCAAAALESAQLDKDALQRPPLLPLLVRYEFIPEYFVEWLRDSPDYSMIEAYVYRGGPEPIYRVGLVDKKTGKRVNYCNAAAMVARLKQDGDEAYQTPIDFEAPAPADLRRGATFGFGLQTKDKQRVLWRLILTSEVSPAGEGLTDTPRFPGLLLMYRERGTAAWEGSAVQIGDRVYEAEPWKEISSPPYFVAYRGSYTQGMHLLNFSVGRESWSTSSVPQAIQKDAEWKLQGQDSQSRVLRVERAGDPLRLNQVDSDPRRSAKIELDATEMPRSIELADGPHLCRISFTPQPSRIGFQIDFGKYRGVARGNIVRETAGAKTTWATHFSSPDWAKSRVLESELVRENSRATITVSQRAASGGKK